MNLQHISYQKVKWCFLSGCGWPGVLCILRKWQPRMPVVLLSGAEDTEILLEGLVGSFAGSISLGVVCCTDVLVDIQEAAEVCGEFRRKAYVSVRYYFAGDTVVGRYMGGIECSHSF